MLQVFFVAPPPPKKKYPLNMNVAHLASIVHILGLLYMARYIVHTLSLYTDVYKNLA